MRVQIIASEDDRGFTKRETAFLRSLYPRSQIATFERPAAADQMWEAFRTAASGMHSHTDFGLAQ